MVASEVITSAQLSVLFDLVNQLLGFVADRVAGDDACH